MISFSAALREVPPDLLNDLKQRYADPRRGYHTWEHVGELLTQLSAAHRHAAFADPVAVLYAALFHDAVIEPLAAGNEEASARLAETEIAARGLAVDAETVARLVRLTAQHGQLVPADVSDDEARFLDADLAIVASSPERFLAYERGVAQEYASLPPEVYAAGRKVFLEGLLQKPILFLSAFFRERLDGPARANLRRSLGVG